MYKHVHSLALAECERRPWCTQVICLNSEPEYEYCITPFVSTYEVSCLSAHIVCSVRLLLPVKHLVHPSHVQTKSLMFSWTVRMCFARFVSLAKVAPQPSYSHLNGLIPRCTESICLFRSVELKSCHILPMCRRMDVRLRGPSLHDASYYSLMETSFASFHAFKSLRVISMLCVYMRRHLTWVPNIFSHPGCVHWYGFNFKCTVSTCFLSSASCKKAPSHSSTIRSQFLMNPVNVIFQCADTLNALWSSYGQIHGLMSRCTLS
jgi:hypothetical protein